MFLFSVFIMIIGSLDAFLSSVSFSFSLIVVQFCFILRDSFNGLDRQLSRRW